jgi:hypothetical protein
LGIGSFLVPELSLWSMLMIELIARDPTVVVAVG